MLAGLISLAEIRLGPKSFLLDIRFHFVFHPYRWHVEQLVMSCVERRRYLSCSALPRAIWLSNFVGVPLTLIAGVMAVISTGFLTADFTDLAVTAIRMEDISTAIQLLTLYVPVYVLLYGAFSYIAMRYGHFKRVAAEPHDRDTRTRSNFALAKGPAR